MGATKPEGTIVSPRHLRVLITEDNPRDAKLVASVLESTGFTVQYEVTDSLEFFRERLEKAEFDVILADFTLPNWTAMDALETLKQSGKDVPLIVVTGTLGDEAAVECVKQGAADFVLKDRPARLPAAVQRALEEKRLREDAKRVEEDLRRSQELLGLVINATPALILSTLPDGGIDFCNQRWLNYVGLSLEDLSGWKWTAVIHPEDVAAMVEKWRAAIATGEPFEIESRVRRADGEYRLMFHRKVPLRDERGKIIKWYGSSIDIEDRKRAEAENTRLAAIVNASDDAIFSVTREGLIATWNAGAERMYGYTGEEIKGKHYSVYVPENRRSELPLDEKKLRRGEALTQYEVESLRKDGSRLQVSLTVSPIKDAAGVVTGASIIARDITERKRLEEQLRQAQKMEAVGRLAGGVAHDFNNHLTIINGYSELMLERLSPDHPMRGQLEEIMKAGRRAASLTRQLLAFSRQQVLAPRVLDLNALVADVQKMLQRLIGEDIDLAMVRDPALGQVKADPGQIEQILMNLGVNARDAMPQGGKLLIETANVELDDAYARTHALVTPGRYVMLAVTDTGIGMDAATQARIFEPFFTTKEKGKGTGLGLATVYGIVKQSGGHIWVYSEPGRGTTFKICFPRVDGPAELVPGSAAHGHLYAGSETILLVEDEEAVRALAANILQAKGYKVLESRSPEDALQIGGQHQEPIHLILTDVVLPRMNGRKIAEHLALLRPTMKVLYMSGYTDDAVVRNGVLEAGTAFLQKPFTPAGLARKVREVLDAGREEMS